MSARRIEAAKGLAIWALSLALGCYVAYAAVSIFLGVFGASAP